MTELDDIDGLAAEYVLGTLDAAERAAVAARAGASSNSPSRQSFGASGS